MKNKKRPLAYLGGNIMGHGDFLAREEEANKLDAAHLELDYYSPVRNKSINDKANMTEEENNHLAEKITAADIERLWNSDFTVMCPEQSAIGTMVETGCLFGWKYMADRLSEIIGKGAEAGKTETEIFIDLGKELYRIANKKNYFHYADIRTNHLNEKDWRRSFSINQLLYGCILACSADNTLHNSFDEVLEVLKTECDKEKNA